jgi:hypothetical protein
MPKLSLYRPNKQNDYRFFDRTISEELRVGGTDLYIHKYLGPTDQGVSIDYTQPQYETLNPTNIQDLLFLENRDRTYDPNIYRLRGHYNVQNLDFDLSQFGLFLNNDILFITVHYNDMIDIVGRKLMVGDVLELPHLLDYNPLKETIPVALKRFMQITDANYASEGFSQTWFPHMWRIKCEPLVDSEEFSQILQEPINQDNYLGLWDKTKPYPDGYIISYGDKNYISIADVPAGTNPPNSDYWRLTEEQNLKDILSTYNQNIAINNAALEEAKRLLPKSGYDNSNLYIVPTYGALSENGVPSGKYNQPAPPVNVVTSASGSGAPNPVVEIYTNTAYVNDSPYLRIPAATIAFIKSNILDVAFPGIPSAPIPSNVVNTPTPTPTNQVMLLSTIRFTAPMTDSGSGSVEAEMMLTIDSMMTITGPYGTADNTYATADQNPVAPGFTGTEPYGPNTMDYRADCDPRFQFIARSSPRTFGYSTSYMSGDGQAPNGFPTGAGISFPQNPQVGDYFLRIDYLPQLLYRWDGQLWVRISENVRTDTGLIDDDKTQTASFINNSNVTVTTSGTIIPQKQALSTILTIAPDPLPPKP